MIPLLTFAAVLAFGHCASYPRFADYKGQSIKVDYDKRAIRLNNERVLFLSGAVHPPRFTATEWDPVFDSLVESGLNMVQVYVFWNYHQPTESQFLWSGNANLTDFVVRAGRKNLFVNLRIGPYVCAEWSYGGIPVWLGLKDGVKFRTTNQVWQQEMGKFMTTIVTRLRNQFADRGGPIVLAQIENELHGAPQSYVDWCGQFAQSLKANVPWLMCNGQSSKLTINTCNGGNCNGFADRNGQSGTIQLTQPAMWTENEGGFQVWGENPKHTRSYFWGRDPIELTTSTMGWFARGGSHMNYYMFAGGSHHAQWAGASITNYYAIAAPVCPDLMPHEPSYTHTQQMHMAIASAADMIINNPSQYKNVVHLPWYNSKTNRFENGTQQYAFIYGTASKFVAFIQNDFDQPLIVKFQGMNMTLSPSSVRLVDSTMKVLYDSGVLPEVKTQRKVISNESLVFEKSFEEPLAPNGVPSYTATGPQEKSPYTLGLTDFLYYSTQFNVPAGSYNLVFTSGAAEAFIVYVDGKYVGTAADVRHAEGPNTPELGSVGLSVNGFQVASGNHELTILSMNLGYSNGMGAGSTAKRIGITSTTIYLEKTTGGSRHELGSSRWTMRPYLYGELKQAYLDNTSVPFTNGAATGNQFVWIKTSFKTPMNVMDKMTAMSFVPKGLTRGVFYVNGMNLGRYWTIHQDGSPPTVMTEEFYHIPKDILAAPGKQNSLVIFENTNVVSTQMASVVQVQVTSMAPQKIHDQLCFQ